MNKNEQEYLEKRRAEAEQCLEDWFCELRGKRRGTEAKGHMSLVVPQDLYNEIHDTAYRERTPLNTYMVAALSYFTKALKEEGAAHEAN